MKLQKQFWSVKFKNGMSIYCCLMSQQHKIVCTSTESTCIKMICIQMSLYIEMTRNHCESVAFLSFVLSSLKQLLSKINTLWIKALTWSTGSPSLKYELRRASALLRNIQNIRICMGKKPIVSVTYENQRISVKNSLPYLKCVLRLSCVVHEPIYGCFMGFYVKGFLST